MSRALTFLVFLISSFLESGVLLLVQGCSSSCGEIGNIRYPFRLKGDEAECGDTEYELVCRGNKTILEIYSVEYYVTNISYKSRQLSVVGTEWANEGVCALPSKSVLGGSIYRKFDLQSLQLQWATFVNCSEEIHSQYGYLPLPLPCLNRNSSNGFVYVSEAIYYVGDLEVSCSLLSTVLIASSNAEESSLTDDIFQKLHLGLVLTWKTMDMSVAEILLGCLNTVREVMDAEKWAYASSGLNIFLLPLKIQRTFLGSLLVYEGQRHFVAALILTWVLIILTDIALLVIVLAMVGRFMCLLSIYVFLCHQFWKMRLPIDKIEKFLRLQKTLSPTRYSYSDVVAMTSNFNKKLGQEGVALSSKGCYLVALTLLLRYWTTPNVMERISSVKYQPLAEFTISMW